RLSRPFRRYSLRRRRAKSPRARRSASPGGPRTWLGRTAVQGPIPKGGHHFDTPPGQTSGLQYPTTRIVCARFWRHEFMRKWFLAAGLTVLLLPTTALPQQKTGKGSVYEQLNLFSEAFERIRQDAVEPVADQKLIETAIAGMLSGLDPNSVYLNENEYKALKAPAAETASPGLVLTTQNSQLKVVSPRDGSPAADAGIKPGDLIFTIDKEPTYDLTLPEIEQKLRGPEGSEVTLMLRRRSGG